MEFAKKLRSHTNIDPKPYAKYQNPNSGGYQDIVLTRFFYCYKWQKAITLVKSSHVWPQFNMILFMSWEYYLEGIIKTH